MKFAEQGVENGMAKPVQLAQADTGTMSDGVPASAPPAQTQPPTPPVPKPAERGTQNPKPDPTGQENPQASAAKPTSSSPAPLTPTQEAANTNQGSAGNKADWDAIPKPAGVSEADWTGFKDSLRNNSTLNDHERYSFLMTFGHEGGAKLDENGGGAW